MSSRRTVAVLGPDDRACPIVHVRRQDEEPIKEPLPEDVVDATGCGDPFAAGMTFGYQGEATKHA